MELLERQAELRDLHAAVKRAGQGSGTVVLISGEAGIGKTSLLVEFAKQLAGTARVLFGTCEALLTPRTLGPFRDMARQRGPALSGMRGTDRDDLIDALLDQMSIASRLAVVIVEDAHWADDASLDVIRYLARRVVGLPAMLVLSYRDDELADDHPLRRVTGPVARPGVLHIELRGLSDAAVRRCAAPAGLDPEPVVAAVGGNPFYLTEVLAAPGVAVPPSVRHAVLARVASLPPGRSALEQLAVVPSEVEAWLVAALVADPTMLADAELARLSAAGIQRRRPRRSYKNTGWSGDTWLHTGSYGCDTNPDVDWQNAGPLVGPGGGWDNAIGFALGFSNCTGIYWALANWLGANIDTDWSDGVMNNAASSIQWY